MAISRMHSGRAVLTNAVSAARAAGLHRMSRVHHVRCHRALDIAALSQGHRWYQNGRPFSYQRWYDGEGHRNGGGSRARTSGGMVGKALLYFLTATGAVVWAVQLGEVAVFYYFPERWHASSSRSHPCCHPARRLMRLLKAAPADPLLVLTDRRLQVPRDHGARTRRRASKGQILQY